MQQQQPNGLVLPPPPGGRYGTLLPNGVPVVIPVAANGYYSHDALFLAHGPSFGHLPANVQWAPASDSVFQPVVYHHPFGHQPIGIPTSQVMGLQVDQVIIGQQQLGLNPADYFGAFSFLLLWSWRVISLIATDRPTLLPRPSKVQRWRLCDSPSNPSRASSPRCRTSPNASPPRMHMLLSQTLQSLHLLQQYDHWH